jgi:hypothetical protein
MGAHDSAFLRDAATGNSLAGNQYLNATQALDAGLRMLQAQVHNLNGTLELCHTSCSLLDAGPLESWLADINDWMVSNTNDVVTILLVNSDNESADEFGQAFSNSGLGKLGYTPESQSATGSWPTLQTMISKNTRLVSFVTNIDASSTYPYLMSEFNYVFETTFGVTSLDGFNCTLQRPSTESSAETAIASNFMGLLNHFKDQEVFTGGDVTIPDVTNIDITNSNATTTAGNLGLQIQTCAQQWGITPNFVLVDFWNEGQTIQAADHQNGLTDITGRTAPSSSSGTNSSNTPGSQSTLNMPYVALLAFLAGVLLLV